MVDVVESGRRARGIEAARTARIECVGVVDAVPHAGVVARAQLMVKLENPIRSIDGIPENTGGDLGPWVTDCRESRIDNGHCAVDDCRQTGLVQTLLLEVAKVERAPTTDGAPETC